MNVLIVFATMIAADMVNHAYRATHSTTVRDMDTSPAMKYFYSFSQIHGTTYILIGLRRYSVQYVIVWVVQFTAFMMTLRRKNVFSHTTWILIYATILGSGFAVSEYDTFVICKAWHVPAIANLMVFLRLNLYCNKYLMWAFCAVIVFSYRGGVVSTPIPNAWAYICVASTIGIALTAHSKISAANAKIANENAQKVSTANAESADQKLNEEQAKEVPEPRECTDAKKGA
jgi:hypothetical protein